MRRGIFFLLILFVFAGVCVAQESDSSATPIDPAFREDVLKLLDMIGTKALIKQSLDAMIPVLKQMAPNTPDEYWTRFVMNINYDEVYDMYIPIYAKYYTHEDIKGLIEFYNTPLGRKMAAVTPKVAKESMEAGMEWGEKLGMQVMQDIQYQNQKKK